MELGFSLFTWYIFFRFTNILDLESAGLAAMLSSPSLCIVYQNLRMSSKRELSIWSTSQYRFTVLSTAFHPDIPFPSGALVTTFCAFFRYAVPPSGEKLS